MHQPKLLQPPYWISIQSMQTSHDLTGRSPPFPPCPGYLSLVQVQTGHPAPQALNEHIPPTQTTKQTNIFLVFAKSRSIDLPMLHPCSMLRLYSTSYILAGMCVMQCSAVQYGGVVSCSWVQPVGVHTGTKLR